MKKQLAIQARNLRARLRIRWCDRRTLSRAFSMIIALRCARTSTLPR
ncbi:MAG: hypothetical protein LBF91_04455 [Azoarcus sp.]|jgi:hypothetical protein|nr:hypothetical protein [Azoarcus sp.]